MVLNRCFLAVAAVSCCYCLALDPKPYDRAEIKKVIETLCIDLEQDQIFKCFDHLVKSNGPTARGALEPENVRRRDILMHTDIHGATAYGILAPSPKVKILEPPYDPNHGVRGDRTLTGKPIEHPIEVAIKFYLGAPTPEKEREWYQMERKGTQELADLNVGPPPVNLLRSFSNGPLLGNVLIVNDRWGPTAYEVLQYIFEGLGESPSDAVTEEKKHLLGSLAMNVQVALLEKVVEFQANKARHCMAILRHIHIKPADEYEADRYRRGLSAVSSDNAREFLYKSKVLQWPLPDGSTVPILLNPDKVVFTNSLFAHKVEDLTKKQCVLPNGKQQMDVWMVNLMREPALVEAAKKRGLKDWLDKIESAFEPLRLAVKEGKNALRGSLEDEYGRTTLERLGAATMTSQKEALHHLDRKPSVVSQLADKKEVDS